MTEQAETLSNEQIPFVYDLASETVFYALKVEKDKRKIEVIAQMRRYIPGDMIQLLQERESEFVNSSSDADALDLLAPGAFDANRKFFEKHLIGISAREIDPKTNEPLIDKNTKKAVEFQKASPKAVDRLDAIYKIRALIIRLGYLGIVEEEIESSGDFVLEEEFGDTLEKEFSLKVVDPDDEYKEKEIRVRFVCRTPTAEDRKIWDQCTKSQTLKKGGHRVRYNYSRIEHLANSMIVGVKFGLSLGGSPLNESNRTGRDGWEEGLDYIFKFRLMDSVFTLATEKNA